MRRPAQGWGILAEYRTKKEGAAVCVCRARGRVCGHESEDKLPTQFQQTRPVIASDGAEIAVAGVVIQVLKFRMVEGVEGFEAQFELRGTALPKRNGLEQGEVPVKQAGPYNGVSSGTAKSLVRSALPGRQRNSKRALAVPGAHGLWIGDLGHLVGPIGPVP